MVASVFLFRAGLFYHVRLSVNIERAAKARQRRDLINNINIWQQNHNP
jgi:hypothetical protein